MMMISLLPPPIRHVTDAFAATPRRYCYARFVTLALYTPLASGLAQPLRRFDDTDTLPRFSCHAADDALLPCFICRHSARRYASLNNNGTRRRICRRLLHEQTIHNGGIALVGCRGHYYRLLIYHIDVSLTIFAAAALCAALFCHFSSQPYA